MPSYSNPNSFIPSLNAYETNAALDMVNQGVSNASVPFSPVHKGLSAIDTYAHITIPVVLRSGARGITRGGYMDVGGLGEENDLPWWKNEWLEKYSPRAWKRTATAWSFDPRNMAGPNFLFFKTGKHDKGELTKLGQRFQDRLQKSSKFDPLTNPNPDHWIMKSGLLENSGNLAHVWDPRMLSRISASGDFARMDTLSAKNVAGLTNYLRAGQNEGLATGLEDFVGKGGQVAGKDAAMLTRLGVRGAGSGRLMGAWEGLRFGSDDVGMRLWNMGMGTNNLSDSTSMGLNWGQQTRSWATDEAGEKLSYSSILRGDAISKAGASAARTAGTKVTETAGKDIAKKLASRLALTAAEAGGAIAEGGLNPIMDILAIASIAELGFDVAHIGASVAANETKAAITSFRGDIGRTPGQGFGFHDTVSSATARQRGLQAIATSRLNARSILGNEAGPMAAHFGYSEQGY